MELAKQFNAWLSAATADYQVPYTKKSFIAGTLLFGSISHFNAICYLAQAGAFSSAFALLRVEWQALINALWMHLCCPEEQAEQYFTGEREFPGLQRAIKLVEDALPNDIQKKPFTQLQVSVGKAMHTYTHMGALQIQAWANPGEIHLKFPPAQVDAMLYVSCRLAMYAATVIAWLTEDEVLEAAVYQQFLSFNRNLVRLGDIEVPRME